MSSFPGSPRLVKGGLVLLDPLTSQVINVVALQYNPESLSRTLQAQAIGNEPGDRLEALRLSGPPHETIKLDAEIDATDYLEFPNQGAQNQRTAEMGLFPQLAALETIVYPPSQQLIENDRQAGNGMIEIAPMEGPLVLFVWSKNRILPVRLTDFSVTEEAFDSHLNPIRAKVSLGMRVLTVTDLGFQHRGGTLYMLYQQQKERMAGLTQSAELGPLGINTIPGG
jgi:hypothetical protein